MKIHSDKLDTIDFLAATFIVTRHTGEAVDYDATRVGSRSRSGAWNLHLSGDGSVVRRRTNPGNGSGERRWALSHHGWGWFLSFLFIMDPDAIAGPYRGRDDFHAQTEGDYRLVRRAAS